MFLLILVTVVGSGPCAGLPLTAGTAWTYRAEVRWTAIGADSIRHTSFAWTTTVVATLASDSSVVATVEGWPTDLAWWEPGRAATISVVYCLGGRVYVLHPPVGAAPTVAAALLRGGHSVPVDDLVLQLPLRRGQLFGGAAAERHDGSYTWVVQSADPIPPSIRRLRAGLTDSLYSVIFRTNPDHTILGVVPGLGVVHYAYAHHGTTAEADAWLIGYHEGKP